MLKIYTHPLLPQQQQFYGSLLSDLASFPSIHAHLKALASRMWEGLQQGKEVVLAEIGEFHRDHLGRNPSLLKGLPWQETDCMLAVANEYGFRRWAEVTHLHFPYDMVFENTVQALLHGEARVFESSLKKHPSLPNQKSRYGHQATLLHYAVCNGVELWRQQIPSNLPRLLQILLDAGANPLAKMKVYGGEYTAGELLMSSARAMEAGLSREMQTVFEGS